MNAMNARNVKPFYEHDHDRLDEHFSMYRKLKRTDFPAARTHFREFLIGLKRHILWEEEILFPMFEDKTGMKNGGPTEVMRMEHREVKACLEAIHDKVRAQDPNTDGEETALLGVLGPHNDKEEQILYPAIDLHLSDEEKLLVFSAMESVPEEKYNTCCG